MKTTITMEPECPSYNRMPILLPFIRKILKRKIFYCPVRYRLLAFITSFVLFASLCNAAEKSPPFKLPPKGTMARIKSAVIETNKGKLFIELFPEIAPWHVANLKYLADQGFYDGLPFHIFEPGYVIQTGAPGEELASGPGYGIPPEFSDKLHQLGTLSMVRKPNDLDVTHARMSHGSQFRILLRNARHMNGTHTIFGQVKQGFDVLKRLRKNDKIIKLTVFVRKSSRKERRHKEKS
ncbi:MAG: peptidylprolyl isomerase [Bdellovibrionales bacterium]|nr:peptidylprolyl isomerase [Bdellovibrionales bacterium]